MDCANLPVGISWYSVLSAWRAGEMPISRFCDFARECGADGIEVLDAFLYAPGIVRDHLPETGRIEAELAESVGSIRVHAIAVTNDFAHEAPDRVALERAKIDLGVSLAQKFDSSLVRVFSAHPSAETVESSRQRAIEQLQKVERHGRTLALENHGSYFGTPAELLAISKGAGTGICFDIGNWILAGVDPVQAAHELPFPDLIHIKDFSYDAAGSYQDLAGAKLTGASLGAGIVPIRETLKALFARPDRRPVPIDLELECGDHGVEATREGVKWLRDVLAQLDSSI